LVRSDFLGKKPVQTGLAQFFWFWLGFFGLAWFFDLARLWLDLARFFLFFSYKTETEPNRPIFSKF
jgi:hypothetical protein